MNTRAVEFFNGLPGVMPQMLRITHIDISRFAISHQQDQLAPFRLFHQVVPGMSQCSPHKKGLSPVTQAFKQFVLEEAEQFIRLPGNLQ